MNRHDPPDPAPPVGPELDPDETQDRPGCGWMLLLGLIGVTTLVAFGVWAAGQIHQRNLAQPLLANFRLPDPTIRPPDPDLELKIFLIARDRFLSAQSRMIPGQAQDIERIHQIARELELTPATGLLQSPLAGGASIRGLYLLDSILYLDLSRQFRHHEQPSPVLERLMVYSLVNSFMLNAPSLRGVRVMIDGETVRTAWGWLDLTSPLGPDLSLAK